MRTNGYPRLLKTLYRQTVPLIQPGQLSREVEEGRPLVLLDTRAASEYRVSRLQGAVLVPYEGFSVADVAAIPRASEVVVYCSVGYRSERVGEKLQALGFTNVRNLYGGILEWVNQGYPVFEGQEKTDRVHAYSRPWGRWLKNGEKLYD